MTEPQFNIDFSEPKVEVGYSVLNNGIGAKIIIKFLTGQTYQYSAHIHHYSTFGKYIFKIYDNKNNTNIGFIQVNLPNDNLVILYKRRNGREETFLLLLIDLKDREEFFSLLLTGFDTDKVYYQGN